jgi:hypothetical protein
MLLTCPARGMSTSRASGMASAVQLLREHTSPGQAGDVGGGQLERINEGGEAIRVSGQGEGLRRV